MILRWTLLLVVLHASSVMGADQTSNRVIVIAHRRVHDVVLNSNLPAPRSGAQHGCDDVEAEGRSGRENFGDAIQTDA